MSEPAPDTSWLRLECMLCHEHFGIDDEHRCPRRAVLLNSLPVIAAALLGVAVMVAAYSLLWAP